MTREEIAAMVQERYQRAQRELAQEAARQEVAPRRAAPVYPETRLCEALLCAPWNGTSAAGRIVGARCGALGERREGTDRWLCWVHNKARLNPARNRPLEYVTHEADVEQAGE